MRMDRLGTLALVVGALMAASAANAQDCPLRIDVTASKPLYQVDEPIEVSVRFDNMGPVELKVPLGYPTLSGFGEAGLAFTATGPLKPLRLPGDAMTETIEPIVTIPKDGSVTSKVYLQRFLTGFVPGKYQVPWSITVPCMTSTQPKPRSIAARGTVHVEVVPGTAAGLTSVFEQLVEQLNTGDAFRQREAVEALQVSSSPLAIPYLERLPALGYRQQAFEALARFPGSERAQQFVLQSLRTGKLPDVIASARVLLAWKHRVPDRDVRTALEGRESAIQVEVLRYLGRTGDRSHLPLLQEYAANADPAVARAAKEASSALSGR